MVPGPGSASGGTSTETPGDPTGQYAVSAGEDLQRDGNGVCAGVGRPRLRQPCREFGEPRGVDDLVGLTDADHAPSGAGLTVDVVHLEGNNGVASRDH